MTMGTWPEACTECQSVRCSPASRCSAASATPPRSRWFIWLASFPESSITCSTFSGRHRIWPVEDRNEEWDNDPAWNDEGEG